MAETRVTFSTDLCKGCSLCVSACPKGIIELNADLMNARGFHPSAITDQKACIACAFCAIMCPDCVITVEKG